MGVNGMVTASDRLLQWLLPSKASVSGWWITPLVFKLSVHSVLCSVSSMLSWLFCQAFCCDL